MDNIKFSIIIPVYNTKLYLPKCIDSILNQNYKEYEIILVDDGSTDGADELCDSYSQHYSNVITIHKKNGGQSSARNMGIKTSSGDYLLFVDSDDYIAEDALLSNVREINKYGSELELVLSDRIYEVNNNDKLIKKDPEWDARDFCGLSGKEAMVKTLENGDCWSPCGKCYKASFWKEKGFSFKEGRIAEDFELIGKVVLSAKKISMIPGYYYYRSMISSSTMHTNYRKLVGDTIFAIDSWLSYINSEQQLGEQLTLLLKKRLSVTYEHIVLANIFYIKSNERKEIIKKVANYKSLLYYNDSLENRLIRGFILVLGINITCMFLNLIKRHRKGELFCSMN